MILRSALTPVLLAAVLSSISACAGAPINKPIKVGTVDTGSGSVTEARKFLEGRWTLESFEVHPPGKPVVNLKGMGTLTYDDFGNLRMEIRADQAASDQLRAAGFDIRDGIISSDGRTAVDMPNRTLTYVIQGQPPAGGGPWQGRCQPSRACHISWSRWAVQSPRRSAFFASMTRALAKPESRRIASR